MAYYDGLGVKVEQVMTDNRSCYKSFAFRRTCHRRGLKHIRTKPCMPRTNGKAERFIQTSLRELSHAPVEAMHDPQLSLAQLRPPWPVPNLEASTMLCRSAMPPTGGGDPDLRASLAWFLLLVRLFRQGHA
jgi:transposase InsO family protein